MTRIRQRLERIEASRGIKPLPCFERMTPEQRETWFKEATKEDINQVYKKLMATIRGCQPWEVENMDSLTDEELDTIMREAGEVFTATQA